MLNFTLFIKASDSVIDENSEHETSPGETRDIPAQTKANSEYDVKCVVGENEILKLSEDGNAVLRLAKV